jgi:hypothetical protein
MVTLVTLITLTAFTYSARLHTKLFPYKVPIRPLIKTIGSRGLIFTYTLLIAYPLTRGIAIFLKGPAGCLKFHIILMEDNLF